MSVVQPLQEIGEQIEKAFYAIENMQLPQEFPLIRDASMTHTWFPQVEIEEVNGNYLVRAALSGLDPDEVDVEIDNNLLVLKTRALSEYLGEQTLVEFEESVDETNPSEETLEEYGECVYQIPLPANVDANGAVAEFVEDTLEIQLPQLRTNAS